MLTFLTEWLGSQVRMAQVLQVLAVIALLVALVLLPEVAWGFIRLRRLKRGIDIGPMPGGMDYWYGPRLKAGAVASALALIAGALTFGASSVNGASAGDFLTRLLGGGLGVVWLHDAFRWPTSWFFRPGFAGRWARRQSHDAQLLFRIFIGLFGALLVLAALFGQVVHH